MLRLSLRFLVPLLIVLGGIAYAVVPLVDVLMLRWWGRDLELRATLVANNLSQPVIANIEAGSRSAMKRLFDHIIEDERLFAVAYFDPVHGLSYQTESFPPELRLSYADAAAKKSNDVLELGQGPLHVAVRPIVGEGRELGKLMLVHDMSFAARRSAETKKYLFWFFVVLGIATSLITVIIANLSWRGWVAGARGLLRGELLLLPARGVVRPELKPLVKDLRALVNDLEAERRARDESQITWSPQALRRILHEDLAGDEVLIVSNREPYIHLRAQEHIEVQLPASGLVTALEPVRRACSGTWIAHGSGSADRDMVDEHDRVSVPPERPSYQIRRVWMTPEEELGYYYGFSNEGLWPLCHIAHTRPTFRSSDWKCYDTINRRFADAVLAEARTSDPVVLVQDYHLALLPRLIQERLPRATIIAFWHIPWPNAEAFAICPWREELLTGLLGSSILGFHTRFHCNNFIDSVDRFLEARIDRETSVISFQGKLTAVNHYPISIEWPVRWLAGQKPIEECRAEIRRRHGLSAERRVGIGVDRLDYTKGIIERFLAVERLLELEPHWIGKFTFIQIAAPSRSKIEQYQQFDAQVRVTAARINERFGRPGYEPILLMVEHHEPNEVYEYYRAADLCYVSSLHDGMNLVAKEFVSAREDERGVLVLSQFTGAMRELPEALIVNPYNIDQCAAALHLGLMMPEREQRERMRSMRHLIQEFNVYRWAGRMLLDAARMRQRRRVLGEGNGVEKSVHGMVTP